MPPDGECRPVQLFDAVQLNMTGISIRAAAAIAGVSPSTVHRDLSATADYLPDENGAILVGMTEGLDGKRRPSRRVDNTARDAKIRELRSNGKTVRAVATEMHCSVGTVHRVAG